MAPTRPAAAVLSVDHRVDIDGALPADELAQLTGLSKARIKDAMTKGALLLVRGRHRKRLRRARTRLRAGDRLQLRYDPDVLSRVPPQARRIHLGPGYQVWFKPAGLLSQGTDFGDHCALLRQVEQTEGPAWLVHRLDREASGLMVVATRREAAAALSRQFSDQQVDKRYRVRVSGRPSCSTIEQALDGRPARTRLDLLSHAGGESLLEVRIDTGRKHQIRRHLAALGCPVIGDRRYGGKPADQLALCAWHLGFRPPGRAATETVTLPEAFLPPWFHGE